MKYTKLGNTDIEVSKICVGGMSFGEASSDFHLWTLDQKRTDEMLAHAFELGVNFIDTANQYAGGTSELFIGRSLKNLGVPRDRVVIASKVYFNEGKLSKKAILREIDGTLERLGTDYVDLYQIHRFDYDTPMSEVMETLDSLVKAGKVRAIGASAMYGYQFNDLQQIAKDRGLTQFVTMQNHYNLLYREDEREMIPVTRKWGVSLIPYSPLAAGHLARRNWDEKTGRSVSDSIMKRKYDPTRDADMHIVERVAELADRYGVSMAQIALAWHFHKGVAAPIVGATNIRHFDDACRSVDLELTKDDIRYLEELYLPHRISGAVPPPEE